MCRKRDIVSSLSLSFAFDLISCIHLTLLIACLSHKRIIIINYLSIVASCLISSHEREDFPFLCNHFHYSYFTRWSSEAISFIYSTFSDSLSLPTFTVDVFLSRRSGGGSRRNNTTNEMVNGKTSRDLITDDDYVSS